MDSMRCGCLALFPAPDFAVSSLFVADEVMNSPRHALVRGHFRPGILQKSHSFCAKSGFSGGVEEGFFTERRQGAFATGFASCLSEAEASSNSRGCSEGHVSVGQNELVHQHDYLDGSRLHFRRNMIASSLAFAVFASAGLISDAVGAEVGETVPLVSQTPSSANGKPVEIRTDSWYRYKGRGFVVKVPPDFEDVLDTESTDDGDSLYGDRSKEKPFLARFASVDRKEVLSIMVRPVSQLMLSFFEARDITALGSVQEAAKIFVPGGAKVIGLRSRVSDDNRIYYLYEFTTRDQRVAMVVGASGGQLYVAGAVAPQDRWRESAAKLRLAALSFSLR